MMAAFFSLFDTACLGCVGLLALLRPQDIAPYLMFVFDSLAVGACIAAALVCRARENVAGATLLTFYSVTLSACAKTQDDTTTGM